MGPVNFDDGIEDVVRGLGPIVSRTAFLNGLAAEVGEQEVALVSAKERLTMTAQAEREAMCALMLHGLDSGDAECDRLNMKHREAHEAWIEAKTSLRLAKDALFNVQCKYDAHWEYLTIGMNLVKEMGLEVFQKRDSSAVAEEAMEEGATSFFEDTIAVQILQQAIALATKAAANVANRYNS